MAELALKPHKEPYSIGGYCLSDLTTFKGTVSLGYQCVLWRGKMRIASILCRGDGTPTSIRYGRGTGREDDERNYLFILKDMQYLLTNMRPILSPDGLWTVFLDSVYSATEGFVLLLLELREFYNVYERVYNKTRRKHFYFLGRMGTNWFTEKERYKLGFYFTSRRDFTTFDTAYTEAVRYISRNRENFGDLTGLAILTGKMDWRLNIETYRALYIID